MLPDAVKQRVVLYDPSNFTPYYNDDLAGALRRAGAKVTVVGSEPLFEADAGLQSEGIDRQWLFFRRMPGALRKRRVLRQFYKGAAYPAGVWRTWCELRQWPPSVLHVQWSLFERLDAWLCGKLKERGWKIAYTAHDMPPVKGMLSLAETVIVHTPRLGDDMRRLYPEAAKKVRVIPHGAHIPAMAAEGARARLGLPEQIPVILFFGMLKPYKGVEDLVEAMPEVVRRVPGTLLVIAGEPMMPMEGLLARNQQLGLEGNVQFRLGFVPGEQVADYYCAADLVVAPYREIAASGVVVQAMSYARPVLATAVGGLPDFITHQRTGFLVKPGSREALTDGLVEALKDRNRLAATGTAAREWLERNNSWDAVARETLDSYGR